MDVDQMISDLEMAIASGVKKVVTQSSGVRTEIEYHSVAEMERALANLKARKNKRSRTILAAL